MREIGRILREARIARNLDIADVAQKTYISGHYLAAMEDGRFHVIPKVFDRGYLKIYAKLLDMDAKPILALYDRIQNEANTYKSTNAV
jgi:cytoskeleton protein RodZ